MTYSAAQKTLRDSICERRAWAKRMDALSATHGNSALPPGRFGAAVWSAAARRARRAQIMHPGEAGRRARLVDVVLTSTRTWNDCEAVAHAQAEAIVAYYDRSATDRERAA